MNGMDKIAARILEDARLEAEARRLEAEQSAAVLRAQADQDARQVFEAVQREADAEAERQVELLVAAAETESKKSLLQVKQELLGEAFQAAVEKLRALPPEDYIRLLARLAVDAAETGKEAVLLNPDDRQQFGAAVVEEANRLGGGHLTLSQETRPIIGGVILTQGNIEVNCALDTLAALYRNSLAAQAAQQLFS